MPQGYTIQKLRTPLTNGNNLIFRVEFFPDTSLPQTIDIYQGTSAPYVLKDDGTFPDITANDFIYSVYFKDSISAFLAKVDELQNIVLADSQFLHFTGHIGEAIHVSEFALFDKTAFNNFEEVALNAYLVDLVSCNDNLLKENSLFITDLSVVEDLNRTYNPVNATLNQQNLGNAGWTVLPEGNDEGVWTFGHMMKNIANTPATTVSVKVFLKEWVKTLRLDEVVAMQEFIGPWISRARGLTTPITVQKSNQVSNFWETEWDNVLTTEEGLIKNAPFKLTAIVNRLDLRQNVAYNTNLLNAGETRFIFTMVNPYTGKIPLLSNNAFTGQNFIDWKGFNVIFEYGNVQANPCTLQDFAFQWYDLSSLTLGTTAYNDALDAITETVTAANSAPSRINGSAINRIRTNEKCFSSIFAQTDAAWAAADWQLRQMELSSTSNLFELVPVTNVPIIDPNNSIDANHAVNVNRTGADSYDIIQWAFANNVIKNRIKLGNYNIPSALLSDKATLNMELADIYGFDYTQIPGYNINNASLEVKEIENQLSLNTCQGCHAGSNKTMFTQVRPATYGQPARYWTSTPDVASVGDGHLDNRGSPFYYYPSTPLGSVRGNMGITFDNFLNTAILNTDIMAMANGEFQMVSAFLTGRVYRGNGDWEDDELDENDNNIDDVTDYANNPNPVLWSDNRMDQLFYVNDPHNDNTVTTQIDGGFPQHHDQKWGFNDLELRKQHLCKLLKLNCTGGMTVFDLMGHISFMPFPVAAH